MNIYRPNYRGLIWKKPLTVLGVDTEPAQTTPGNRGGGHESKGSDHGVKATHKSHMGEMTLYGPYMVVKGLT